MSSYICGHNNWPKLYTDKMTAVNRIMYETNPVCRPPISVVLCFVIMSLPVYNYRRQRTIIIADNVMHMHRKTKHGRHHWAVSYDILSRV